MNMPVSGTNQLVCPCCNQPVEANVLIADDASGVIMRNGKSVRFTPVQFKLAKFLIDRSPLMAAKDSIYDSVFMDVTGNGPEMKIMDVVICKIRPLLAEIGLVIETVWGKGYRLVEASPEIGNSIKETSLRQGRLGAAHRWTTDDDARLLELIGRKLKPTACAAIMRLPYMTVERHYRRLMELPDVEA